MHENPYAAPVSSGAVLPAPTESRSAVFHWPLVIAVILWTVIAIILANEDRSWGALYIAIVIGPAVNAAALLVAVVYGALRKSWDRQIRIGTAIMVVFGAAVVSTMVIFGSIMSMQLHGC